jgi:hypothetical protein
MYLTVRQAPAFFNYFFEVVQRLQWAAHFNFGSN